MENKRKTIVSSSKDRLIRFGDDWVEKFCETFNTKIIMVNHEVLSPKKKFVPDIISILPVFRCRGYGLRKEKNQIEEGGDIAEELQDRNQSNAGTKAEDQ